MADIRFVLGQCLSLEENLHCEFKEVKGSKPVQVVKNTADEYVVAYLNRHVSGSIFWGIRDSNREIVGVKLGYQKRDTLRKDVISMLSNIQPAISPAALNVLLHKVFNSPDDEQPISDLYVVEVRVPEVYTDALYFTGGNEAFVKTAAGKKKLSGPALEDELWRRLQSKAHTVSKNTSKKKVVPFEFLSALRRAKLVRPILEGAQVLWVDDNPGNNIYERMALKSVGISVEVALSTDEAVHMLALQDYDVIISDMERFGESDAGLQLLNQLQDDNSEIPVIFYTWWFDDRRGTPLGAFGMTNYPDDLLHLVLDVLERKRA